MKKILIILLVLVSTSVFAQKNSDSIPYTRLVTQNDLPMGKTFVVLPLDGTVAFSGVVDEKTVNCMPLNTPFVLKVTGVELKKFNIYDKKSLK